MRRPMSYAADGLRTDSPVAPVEPDKVGRRRLRTAIGILIGLAVLALSVAAASVLQVAILALGLIVLVLVVSLFVLSRRDAVTVLTLAVVLLFLVPGPYVLVGPLRSVGNPAQLVGMAALALWCASRITGLVRVRPLNPIRWIILLYAITCLTAYAAGMNRILSVAEEAGAARTLFPTIAMIGIGILAVDGLQGSHHVQMLLQRLVWVAGLASVAGILEFAVTSFSYRDLMRLPGLTTTTDLVSDTRSGFDRIQVAATHPIEYAVTLGAVAPLALHFAIYASTRGQRYLSGLTLLCILAVTPMTVARSGIVALAVGLGVYALHLSNRTRLNLIALGLIGVGVYSVTIPGLLGTLRALLLIGEEDPSIAGRTEDYAKIPGFTAGFEVFGRGLGTFGPLEYFFLDNQYLASLLNGGVVGLFTLILVYVVGFCVARGVRHRSGEPNVRGLGQALAAGIAAFAVSAATFDELAFRQAAFTLFLLVGCAGALWSILYDEPKRLWSGELRPAERPRGRAGERLLRLPAQAP
jgi:hypothetical protein